MISTSIMYDNPETLKDLCIDYVCNNIEKHYISKHDEPEPIFAEHNIYLPMEVSEVLLTRLSERNKLNDDTLSLFNHRNVYLRFVGNFLKIFYISFIFIID